MIIFMHETYISHHSMIDREKLLLMKSYSLNQLCIVFTFQWITQTSSSLGPSLVLATESKRPSSGTRLGTPFSNMG